MEFGTPDHRATYSWTITEAVFKWISNEDIRIENESWTITEAVFKSHKINISYCQSISWTITEAVFKLRKVQHPIWQWPVEQ